MTRDFAVHLARAVAPVPVFFWDERFSTAAVRCAQVGGALGESRGQTAEGRQQRADSRERQLDRPARGVSYSKLVDVVCIKLKVLVWLLCVHSVAS